MTFKFEATECHMTHLKRLYVQIDGVEYKTDYLHEDDAAELAAKLRECAEGLDPQPAAILQAATPNGWKMVPIDPPSTMLDEIAQVDDISYAALLARYRKMLAAVPILQAATRDLPIGDSWCICGDALQRDVIH